MRIQNAEFKFQESVLIGHFTVFRSVSNINLSQITPSRFDHKVNGELSA